MHLDRNLGARWAWLLPIAAVALWSCDDGDGGGGGGEPTLQRGEACATSHPEDCPDGRCEDAVSGQSCDDISCQDWDQPAIKGTICTRRCDSDEDCVGFDFAGTNGERVKTEVWRCDGVCRVHVTEPDPTGGGDLCDGCGGALCAGRCIGCPQC